MSDGSCRFSVKQDTLDSVKFEILKDGTALPELNYSFKAYMTNESTVNEKAWYTILSMNSANTISQIKLPMTSSRATRTAVRCQHNLQAIGSITEPWRALAYADEVPLLKDNGNNTKKIAVDRLEGTADFSKCTAPIINIGSYRNKTVKELKDKLKEIIGASNDGNYFIVEANNVDRDFLANNWFNDAAILTGGASYIVFHISDISGGRTALTTFRTPSFKYEVFLASGNWTKVDKWATQDFVQKAIDEAFKKRNL